MYMISCNTELNDDCVSRAGSGVWSDAIVFKKSIPHAEMMHIQQVSYHHILLSEPFTVTHYSFTFRYESTRDQL